MQKNFYILLFIIGIIAGEYALVSAQWAGWNWRRPVTINNTSGSVLTDFQVKISLNNTNFSFANAKSDGSDLRVTNSGGITSIPFWIESWNQAGQQATIWVKVPSIPTPLGTTIYMYYGNPAPVIPPPDPVETPPIGPYTKDPGNPIVPINDPGNGLSLCAENIVYDDATGHYWMVFANYRTGQSVGLVWSDDPTNTAAWHWDNGSVIPLANAPHIMEYNNTWYIFYADRTNPAPYPISVATSPNVNGPYTFVQEVLLPGASGSWEDYRVDEPYVFQRSDGKWILMYMGDADPTVPVERIGYAEADDILGPYTKFGSNPCIAFGPPGSYDAGTAADPWVYEFDGVYYIGYTVSPTALSPWQTALATTTDWQTFTKHGVILPYSPEFDAFRGAVTRIGNEYVFPYTTKMTSDGTYQMAIATQPVFMAPDIINNGNAVFDFFDGFDGTNIDFTKWTFLTGNSTMTTVGAGLLTMTATGITSTTFPRINGLQQFGMNYIAETLARHPNQGTENLINEVGFIGTDFLNIIRIVDDFPSTTHWQKNAQAGVGIPIVDMQQTADQNWHVLRLYRESPGTAGFQIDDTSAETVNTNVPTINLSPFLMSYGNGNQFIVNWTRVRKYVAIEPTANVGTEEINPLPVELNSFSASVIGTKVNLRWMTETEVNNYGFEILRLAQNDKLGWIKIGFVQGNGNSNSPKYYSFEDENLTAGKYSYRLKQIDTDGQFEYSKVIEVDLGAPMKYELTQNYPNPFNPVTTILFSMPEAGEVKLVVYNVLGEQVALLVNENKEAGVHTINFNATELNSGLYIYKLTAGNFSDVKKLMVLK